MASPVPPQKELTGTAYILADSYIQSINPDTNFGTLNTMYVGHFGVGTSKSRLVLRGEIPSIPAPNATIDKVELFIYKGGDQIATSITLGIYELNVGITKDFVEDEVTWNKSTSSQNWIIAGGDFASVAMDNPIVVPSDTWVSFDITDIITDWEDEYFVLIKSESEDVLINNNAYFYTKENAVLKPYIKITYTDPAPDRVDPTATNVNDENKVTVIWSTYTPPADFDHYRLYMSESSFSATTDSGVYEVTGSTITNPATKTYDIDAGVVWNSNLDTFDNDKYYYIAVVCEDLEGGVHLTDLNVEEVLTDWSPIRMTSTQIEPTVQNGTNSILLEWPLYSPPSDMNTGSYEIYRETTNFIDVTTPSVLTPIHTVGPATPPDKEWTDTTPVNGTLYYYAIIPIDIDGYKHVDLLETKSVLAEMSPPKVTDMILTNDRDDNKLVLSWTTYDSSLADLDGYYIYRDTSPFSTVPTPMSGELLDITNPNTKTFEDLQSAIDGPNNNQIYYYAVIPYDTSGNYIDEGLTNVNITSDFSPPKITSLIITNERELDGVYLDWGGYSQDSDVLGYEVYRNTINFSATSGATLIDTITPGSLKLYLNDQGTGFPPSDATLYYYAVVPYDDETNKHITGLTTFNLTTDFKPPRVTSLILSNNIFSNEVELDWNIYTHDSDTGGYLIYRENGSFSDVSLLTPIYTIVGATNKTWEDSSAISGNTYWYAIVPYDNNTHKWEIGLSSFSILANFDPSKPTLVLLDINSAFINIEWGAFSGESDTTEIYFRDVGAPGWTTFTNWNIDFANEDAMLELIEQLTITGVGYFEYNAVDTIRLFAKGAIDINNIIVAPKKYMTHTSQMRDFNLTFDWQAESGATILQLQTDDDFDNDVTPSFYVRFTVNNNNTFTVRYLRTGIDSSFIIAGTIPLDPVAGFISIEYIKKEDHFEIWANSTKYIDIDASNISDSKGRLLFNARNSYSVFKYMDIKNIEIEPTYYEEFYHEIVLQTDIHEFDPTQDTWPSGRDMEYYVKLLDGSGNNIDSDIENWQTNIPIQPVAIDATPWYATAFGQTRAIWDWTDDVTPEEDFVRWDLVGVIEETLVPIIDSPILGTTSTWSDVGEDSEGILTTDNPFDYITVGVVGVDTGGLKRFSAEGP